MEHVDGKPLNQHIKAHENRKMKLSEVRRLFKMIMEAVEFVHSSNVVHRDIKLENILIDKKGKIKLIDFGFSIGCSKSRKLKMFCGTPSYMAPEIVAK